MKLDSKKGSAVKGKERVGERRGGMFVISKEDGRISQGNCQ